MITATTMTITFPVHVAIPIPLSLIHALIVREERDRLSSLLPVMTEGDRESEYHYPAV